MIFVRLQELYEWAEDKTDRRVWGFANRRHTMLRIARWVTIIAITFFLLGSMVTI